MVVACDGTSERGQHVGPADDLRARVETLHQAFGPELYRFLLGVTRNPETAGDAMQAAFAKALELGHEARPEAFKGWLFRVALHEALAVRRRDRTGERAVQHLAEIGRVASERPEAGLIQRETIAAVRQALDALPGDQREVVVARMYGDRTFAQIARDAQLPLGTVLSRMRLGLEKLRKALGERVEG
jgi:RNA polymerase sigma factor (sigma-70 family)